MAAAAARAEPSSEKGLLGEGSPSPLGGDEEGRTQAAREQRRPEEEEIAQALGAGALGEEKKETARGQT